MALLSHSRNKGQWERGGSAETSLVPGKCECQGHRLGLGCTGHTAQTASQDGSLLAKGAEASCPPVLLLCSSIGPCPSWPPGTKYQVSGTAPAVGGVDALTAISAPGPGLHHHATKHRPEGKIPIPRTRLRYVHLLPVFASAVSADPVMGTASQLWGVYLGRMSAGSRSTLCPFSEPGSHFIAQDSLDLTASQVLKQYL